MRHVSSDKSFASALRAVLLGALFFAFLGPFRAGAQRILAVDPPVKLYRAQPGDTITGSITVLNPGGTRVRAVLSLADWRYREDGTPVYPDAGTLERSLCPWVTFTPAEAMLGPGERATVRYTIDVPADAAAGSHWGELFVTGEDPEPPPGRQMATFSVRVGHTMYVNVPPEEPAGEIAGIFGEPPASPGGAYNLAIQYHNSGNVAQQVRGHVILRDGTGSSVNQVDVPLFVTLPGETTVRVVKVTGPLEAGAYSALVVYNYGDAETDVAGEYGFVLEEPLAAPESRDDRAAGGAGGQ